MAGSRVLIVDDDRAIVKAIQMRLNIAGFETMRAFDGAQGLEIALNDTPDAVILDLRMPVMDGFAMLDRLRNSVHTARVPAIILSADAADRARLKALRRGATYYVEKPYKPEDLIRALNAALTPTRYDAPSSAPKEKAMPIPSDIKIPTNRRVMIVDDDPAVVRALSLRCKKLGLEVETAENGLNAILKAQRRPPRMLILDINMPEVDGFRVCEWLLDPERPPVDVVMLTGRSDSETLGRCDSLGTYYVAKNRDTWDMIKSIVEEIFEIDTATLEAAIPMKVNPEKDELSREQQARILVVDDDKDLARALARRLAKIGAQTFTASNGIEAYRVAVREKPDLIIADYVMPEGGGHYLLWRLKSTEATKHIPIIMMTGQKFELGVDSPFERESTGRGGAVALLRKPLDTNELFQEIARHCPIEYTAM